MGAVSPTAARQGLPVRALTTSCHSRSLRASSPQLTFISDPQTPRDKVLVPSPTSMLGKFPCGQLWTQQHWETGGEGRHHLGQSQLVELCRPETYPRMLGTGCQMESRQHQCASVDWPLPPCLPLQPQLEGGGRGACCRVSKGPFYLQVWLLTLAIGEGLSGPRWGILFHEVLSEVWASSQPLM